MRDAWSKILELLPECNCDIDALCAGTTYFSLSAKDVFRAAQALPLHHQLCYGGVRLLLSACLEEFSDLFQEGSRLWSEVTVPAPPFLLYVFQEACPDIRFSCGAFFAQIVLRGILLNREPLSLTSCTVRRCGLNQMRIRLLEEAPIRPPEYQLQFGVLCDSCCKAGEYAGSMTRTVSVSFPDTPRCSRALAENFYQSVSEELGIQPDCEDIRRAFALYGRLLRAGNHIVELCSRQDREALWGNSLSLAQSVLLFTADRKERFLTGLEMLARELEDAPCRKSSARMYCYYIPFLYPEIDRRFRERGVELVGNAAFLQTGRSVGLDLSSMTEAWLDNMANRATPEQQCAAIAKAAEAFGCTHYLTGFFGFDRRLGACTPMKRKILKEQYGITTRVLDTDFWCESATFGNPEDRIEMLCINI